MAQTAAVILLMMKFADCMIHVVSALKFPFILLPPSFELVGPSGTRTQDRPVMSRMLWPTELRAECARLSGLSPHPARQIRGSIRRVAGSPATVSRHRLQQAIPCAHHGPLCFWYRNLVRRHEDFSHLRHPVWLILKRSKSAHTHLCALSPAPRASLTSPSAITSRVRVGAGIPSGRGPVSSGVSETHIVFVMSSCALSYELMRSHRRARTRVCWIRS